MRKLKKFKRYAEGGALGAGEGDPFSYTDFKPGQGERNLEGIKDFFGFGKKKPAPTEERDTSNRAPEPVKAEPAKAEPAKAEPAKTSPVKTPSIAQQMADREKGGPNERNNYASVGKTSKPEYDSYSYGPDYMQSGEEGVDSRTFKHRDPKKAEEYRQSLMPVNKPAAAKPKSPTPAAEKTPAAPAKPSYVGAGDSDDSVETKKKNELERVKRVGSGAVEQTMMGPVETVALGASKLPSMARAGLGALRSKGTGKFPEEKPEISVPRTPAVERLKEAKIEGPPASAAAPKPKTPAEQMGVRETKPMRDAREAKEKFEAAGKSAKEAADKSSKNASDEVAAEAAKRAASKRQTPDNRRFPNKGSATTGRPKASGEFRATSNKFDRPVGEKRGPKTDEVLEREGLSAKKGGKIPAFKKGGLVGRGDGCAQRGKTKGRMV